MAVKNALYVDDVLMPEPTAIAPKYNRLWAQESGRTASGNWVGRIQAEKWGLDVTWQYISRDDVKTLMNALLTKAYVTIKFHSPMLDKEKTITCYAGDITVPVYCYALDEIMYEDLTVTIVER